MGLLRRGPAAALVQQHAPPAQAQEHHTHPLRHDVRSPSGLGLGLGLALTLKNITDIQFDTMYAHPNPNPRADPNPNPRAIPNSNPRANPNPNSNLNPNPNPSPNLNLNPGQVRRERARE